MTGSDPAVVVGGGVSGITSALLLTRDNEDVVLLEQESELGGLLRSHTNSAGQSFDRGTHFVLTTGNEKLDELLVGDLVSAEWHEFDDSLLEGHVFNGELSTETGCIDVRALEEERWRQAAIDMIHCNEREEEPSNFMEEALVDYGATITEEVYQPVLEKLTGHDLDELAPGIHEDFQIHRLVLFDSPTSLELKKSPRLGSRIAYTRIEDGDSSISKYYSKQGGVGRWIKHLEEKLVEEGVTIETDARVSGAEVTEDHITSLSLEDGRTIPTEDLVWTIPPAVLFYAAGYSLDTSPPPMRDLHLVHLSFDAPIQIDRHYVNVFDPAYRSYRVTLYPNIIAEGSRSPPPHHVTVEILGEDNASTESLLSLVRSELAELGIVPADASRTYESVHRLDNALPIQTVSAVQSNQEVIKQARSTFKNATFVGQSAGHGGMIDALTDLYARL